MRRYTVNRSSLEAAREMRRKFYDEEPRREIPVPWTWPTSMQEVGTCEAVMYSSDKWQDRQHFIDYKHNQEGRQWLWVTPGFIRDIHQPHAELDVIGPMHRLTDMPDAFAVLAPILGVQTCLYDVSDDGESYDLPAVEEDGYHQINIARAHLGAIRHPRSGRESLIIYNNEGVHCMIVGERIRIEPDGITG